MLRFAAFLRRRFEPNEPYGWPLTLGLAVSLLALQLFLVVLLAMLRRGALVEFDHECAAAMRAHAMGHPAFRSVFRLLTHMGGVPVMAAVALLGGAVLWLCNYRLLAAGWVLAAGMGGLVNYGLKKAINRDRPPHSTRDEAIFETNESFPSGHSMGSVVGFGTLGYVAMLLLRRRSARLVVVVGLLALVLLIGFSRIYLRAHWFSDVLAGFAIGTFWVSLCITALEVLRLRARVSLAAPLTPSRTHVR